MECIQHLYITTVLEPCVQVTIVKREGGAGGSIVSIEFSSLGSTGKEDQAPALHW